MDKQKKVSESDEFSLGIGGLLYQFYLKTSLLKQPLFLYKRRTIVLCLITWAPLFVLALMGGVAFRGVEVPFIYDLDVHVRFLISLPLLIYADVFINDSLKRIVSQFINSNLIALNDRPKFNAYIASAMRLTRSLIAEILIIIFVVIAGLWISKNLFSFRISTWQEWTSGQGVRLTPAGFWYTFISLPIFQFILLRWYYRIAIWYRFLWQVSRLPLKLNSLHPDRAGGIGFLAISMFAFLPILFAHSILLSGLIFNHIYNEGATLWDFQGEIICILIFLIFLPLTPMLFFIAPLINTKQSGTLAYDVTASRYVNNFTQKWVDTPTKNTDLLLGTPDIQTLADLGNSYQVSTQMRITPFSKTIIISIIILIALPLFPLLFTKIPFTQIVSQSMGFIFK